MKKYSRVIQQTLSTTAGLALLSAATPVLAQTSDPAPTLEEPASLEATASPEETAQEESVNGRPIRPNVGRIRGFVGDIEGTVGRIRGFDGSAVGSVGRIRGFASNLQTYVSRIRSFQTETTPTTGTNTAFWGTSVALSGNGIPTTSKINTFHSSFESAATKIRAATSGLRNADGSLKTYAQAKSSYDLISTQITSIISLSKSTFGSAFEKQTGTKFDTAFRQRLLTKYGIDLANKQSFTGLNELDIELFLLDWRDNLLNHTGRDQVDYWMKQVNWSPSLTQQVTGGTKAKIGLLDFAVTASETSILTKVGGVSTVVGDAVTHGSAVISLIGSAHDGRGIMGIAPNAQVVSFNPFDSTYTASWDDIRTGINLFSSQGVSVVNASLGVPGWTLNEGWNQVFGSADVVPWYRNPQLYVISAGNDGVVQPRDIEWGASKNRAIIVVGSVDPFGRISEFSNRPGETCLLTNGVCASSTDLLKNRFIVAPGEFILVSDGKGGVTRLSGTSFSAPLVSGAATLIADRWAWLAWKPNDIADIIFKSATDIGEPGVDAVYGHGLLNVTAALSPLSFNNLYSLSITSGGKSLSTTSTSLVSTAIASRSTWEASGASFTAFEKTQSSFRDFVIPLSSKLIGTTAGSDGRQFQAYLQSRFWDWVATAPKTGLTANARFTENQLASPLIGFGNLKAQFSMKPREYRPGVLQSETPFETALSFETQDQRFGFQFGTGNGSAALSGNAAFGLSSDYDIENGGVNPFLSMASGSGFAAVSFAVNGKLSISTGITGQRAEREVRGSPVDVFKTLTRLRPLEATANTVTVKYKPTSWLTATAGYTKLHEKTALLGVQSLDPADFLGGTKTDAGTLGLDVAVTQDLAIGTSATIGQSRSADNTSGSLAISEGGAIGTAFQFVVTKSKLFDSKDSARISLSQPLHIESGSIGFDEVQVIDRQTGELGVVTRNFALQSGKRSYVTEAIYRRSLLDGEAELSLFGRASIGGNSDSSADPSLTVGTSLRIAF